MKQQLPCDHNMNLCVGISFMAHDDYYDEKEAIDVAVKLCVC